VLQQQQEEEARNEMRKTIQYYQRTAMISAFEVNTDKVLERKAIRTKYREICAANAGDVEQRQAKYVV
jgi:hypothetical protein